MTTEIKSGDISCVDENEVAQRYVNIFNENYIEDIVTSVAQAKKENNG